MLLLQHFNELSLHPKNAAELKGLILQLAVQGKLTAQWRLENPNVEPALELLKRIKAEKAKLVKEKKIKKEKPLPSISEDEIPFELPLSWAWERIGRFNLYGGYGKQEQSEANAQTWVLELEDVEKGSSKLLQKVRFTDRQFKSTKSLFEKGDVIYGKLRPYLDKVIVADEDGVCTTEMIPIKSFCQSSPEYLRIFLKSPHFIDYANGSTHGMRMPRLGTEKALIALVSVPPIEEQKAIVTTVEQLFAEVEQLETLTKERIQLKEDFVTSALQRLTNDDTQSEWAFLAPHFRTFFTEQTNVTKLRETILQLAVQGKLTRSFRARHPELVEGSNSAKALLKRIQTEKAKLVKEKKIKKEKPLPPISADEIPYELPEGWVWCRLGETLLYSDAGKSPDCVKRPVVGEEWGVLTTTAIQKNWFDENANKVLPATFEVNPQQVVESGDILITRAGPINRTGITCKVDSLKFNLILSDKTIRLKYIEDMLFPDFLVLTLNSSEIRTLLIGKMIGMASSQVNISQANIKRTCLPFPPYSEQKVIVDKVGSLLALCDQLEQAVQTSKTTQEQWMQSCLKEVFEEREEVGV